MNKTILAHGVKLETRSEYAVEYLEEVAEQYVWLTGIEPEAVMRGRGHRKSRELRLYDRLCACIEKLKKYSKHIQICTDERNSYSKTDKDATLATRF